MDRIIEMAPSVRRCHNGHESLAELWDCPVCVELRLQQNKADLEAARREILDWENREALVCPEDIGFEDVIKKLQAELEAAQKEIAVLNRMVKAMVLHLNSFCPHDKESCPPVESCIACVINYFRAEAEKEK